MGKLSSMDLSQKHEKNEENAFRFSFPSFSHSSVTLFSKAGDIALARVDRPRALEKFSPARVPQWWAYQTCDLMVVSSIPG